MKPKRKFEGLDCKIREKACAASHCNNSALLLQSCRGTTINQSVKTRSLAAGMMETWTHFGTFKVGVVDVEYLGSSEITTDDVDPSKVSC